MNSATEAKFAELSARIEAGEIEAPPTVLCRRGTFAVSGDYVRESWRELLPLMARVCIIRCEFVFDMDCFIYTALSAEFDEIPVTEKPPKYSLRAKREENGKMTFMPFERIPAAVGR